MTISGKYPRNRLLNCALVLISLFLCMLLSELSFRFYYKVNPHWRDDSRSKYLIPHRDYSHWHPANFTGRSGSNEGEFDVTFSTNSFGMVDKERVFKKNDTYRVAVIGDSFVEGIQVEMKERFSNILEDRFTDKGIPVEFLNFGCSWFSSVLEIPLYKHLVNKFSPDAVVIFVHFTDITDNWQFKRQIVYDSSGNIERAEPNETLSMLRSPFSNALRQSALIEWLYRAWNKYKGVNIRGESLKVNFGAWFKEKLDSDDIDALKFTESNLVLFVNMIKKTVKNVSLVLIPISQTIQKNDDLENRFVRKLTIEQVRNAERFYTWFNKLCTDNNFECIDLREPFNYEITLNPEIRLFYQKDGHFTPEGHMIVATTLEKKLIGVIGDIR